MNILDILANKGLEGLIPPNVNMPQGDIQPPAHNPGKQLLDYIVSNAMGNKPPEGAWYDPGRKPGAIEPGLYAEPNQNMLLGELDPPNIKAIKPLGSKILTSIGDLRKPAEIQQRGLWDVVKSTVNGKTRTRSVATKAYGSASYKYLKKIKNRDASEKTKGALRTNDKTDLSLDFSTDCARRHGEHGACPYCYVEHKRSRKELGSGFMTVNVGEYPYNKDILHMPKPIIDKLNRDGGLRMFSLGDYRPGIDNANVANVLADAKQRGLYIKAITKEKQFIKDWGNHPNLRANISVDALPREMSNAPTIEEALEWAGGRENIKIRAVALNDAQAEMFGNDPRIGVVTLYHGLTDPDKLMDVMKLQNPQLIEALGEDAVRKEVSSWGFKPGARKKIMDKFPNKVCCQSGKCGGDRAKCGFALTASGAVLAGVMLPENKEQADWELKKAEN